MRSLSLQALSLITIFSVPTAAFGGGGSDAAPTALVVYSGRGESLAAPLVAKFQERTGIKVQVRYGGTSELAVLIGEEGRAGSGTGGPGPVSGTGRRLGGRKRQGAGPGVFARSYGRLPREHLRLDPPPVPGAGRLGANQRVPPGPGHRDAGSARRRAYGRVACRHG